MSARQVTLHDKSFSVYFPSEDIRLAVQKVAGEIERDLNGETPLFIGVLNGVVPFAADLLREMQVDCEITFVKLSSYSGTKSTGQVSVDLGLNEKIAGRTIVVLEDIIDTGLTVEKILNLLEGENPKTVKVASLLYKPDAFKGNYKVDYVGKEIPNEFVVGYGLDYDGLGRNLKDIYKIVE